MPEGIRVIYFLNASYLGLALVEVWQNERGLRVDDRMVDVSLGWHKHQMTSNAVGKKSNDLQTQSLWILKRTKASLNLIICSSKIFLRVLKHGQTVHKFFKSSFHSFSSFTAAETFQSASVPGFEKMEIND